MWDHGAKSNNHDLALKVCIRSMKQWYRNKDAKIRCKFTVLVELGRVDKFRGSRPLCESVQEHVQERQESMPPGFVLTYLCWWSTP